MNKLISQDPLASRMGQTVRQFWLRNETARFVDMGLLSSTYLLGNPHWVYPYRVNYDIDNWRMLVDQLAKNPTEIPVMSRLHLLIDAEVYLRQSSEPELYVRLLRYLHKENEVGLSLISDVHHA